MIGSHIERTNGSGRTPGHGAGAPPGPEPEASGAQVAARLLRRLRVSDAPERFQQLAVAEVRAALRVEAAAWVPASRREPIIHSGEVPGLASVERLRGLVPDTPTALWIAPPDADGGPLRAVAAAFVEPETDLAETGRLIAINPIDGRPFGPEVELLPRVGALIATQRANARLYADLKDLLFGVIRSLTSAIDAKDPYTSGHSERVARIAVRLGEQLGLPASQRGDLYLMGLLHDVGKIGIRDEVLLKPGKLTPEEYRQIQQHVRIGVHILTDLKKLHHLLPGVKHHHECLDGSGYPAGLSGESIPLAARILAVADAFDAMSSSRPYRRRLAPAQIDEIFRKGAGTQWDPQVVEALFACRDDLERIRQKGLGESLRLAVGDAMERSHGSA
jgi:HD-GYP domain-containing protein (c-di-GMP phosphodiesterase class II)